MRDKLNLLDPKISLQKRYDDFLRWLSTKNHAIIELMADELGITISEVDVFNELGDLDDEEFGIIDKIGFDIGLLFIVVRAPKDIRKIMYERHSEISKSHQPLTALKSIVDEHSDYASIEELVQKVSGECWKSVSSYLKQRDIVSGTITKKIRGMLIQVGNKIMAENIVTEGQIGWLIRAIEHDKTNNLGIFTNDIVKDTFNDDYHIFIQIHEHIVKYGTN
jgi:hypothetical protein